MFDIPSDPTIGPFSHEPIDVSPVWSSPPCEATSSVAFGRPMHLEFLNQPRLQVLIWKGATILQMLDIPADGAHDDVRFTNIPTGDKKCMTSVTKLGCSHFLLAEYDEYVLASAIFEDPSKRAGLCRLNRSLTDETRPFTGNLANIAAPKGGIDYEIVLDEVSGKMMMLTGRPEKRGQRMRIFELTERAK